MQPALKATSLKSAWCAGFMDTDGYIGLNKTRVIFNLSQKDLFLLHVVAKALNGTKVSPIYAQGRNVQYALNYSKPKFIDMW
jgi:hypothetical protein